MTVSDIDGAVLVVAEASWIHEPADRAVASWTAPVLWRFRLARLHCQSARGLAQSKTWRGLRRFMESLDDFDAVHWDHEPRTSETGLLRCCRRLVGRASLRFLCRQDAGSTLWFMEMWSGKTA